MRGQCETCGAILDENGICPRCEFYESRKQELIQANSAHPISIRVQKTKQVTRKIIYTVDRVQGSYLHDSHKVTLRWMTRPTESPVAHEFINSTWSCDCGKENCIHIIAVKNWRGWKDKAKDDKDTRGEGICFSCHESLGFGKEFYGMLMRHEWCCPYCGAKPYFAMPIPKYSPAVEYMDALPKMDADPARFKKALDVMNRVGGKNGISMDVW